MTTGDTRPLMTAADVAKRAQVHRSTVVRWGDAGVGPRPIRLGAAGKSATVRFDPQEVDRWLQEYGVIESAE